VKLPAETKTALINLAKEKGVYLEGNVLKLLDASDDQEFGVYLGEAINRDHGSRRKRLDITKQFQVQHRELQEAYAKLKTAMLEVENAKLNVEHDFLNLQKKTQFKLMNRVANVALGSIVFIGLSSSAVYTIALLSNRDTTFVSTVWSSLVGILLTNSFSILATVVGVKYGTDKDKKN
jgi:hypothetical protein